VSRKGAVGLTQVMPQIWQCKKQELLNPYRNIEIGSKILKYYIDRNGIHGGLSSYNSGRTDYALDYAHSVLAIANDLKVNKVF
jgi:soluble lytic murein transglycosylase-like protein